MQIGMQYTNIRMKNRKKSKHKSTNYRENLNQKPSNDANRHV